MTIEPINFPLEVKCNSCIIMYSKFSTGNYNGKEATGLNLLRFSLFSSKIHNITVSKVSQRGLLKIETGTKNNVEL